MWIAGLLYTFQFTEIKYKPMNLTPKEIRGELHLTIKK